MNKLVAIVPFSGEYSAGRLFEVGGPLDRDNALRPWWVLRTQLAERGIDLVTSDSLGGRSPNVWIHLDCHHPLPAEAPPDRTVLVLTEPEVVAPLFYDLLRMHTSLPSAVVFTHRLDLVALQDTRIRYLRTPQPVERHDVHRARDLELVMINARKHPVRARGSLYGAREKVAAWFARRGRITVYGPGWGRAQVTHPLSTIRNLSIRRAWAGVIGTKAEVLLRAEFVLCFENMISPGYRTEKLFDALASGALPIYWGDPTIADLVPEAAFIDYRRLGGPRGLVKFIDSMSPEDRVRMRDHGQRFLESEAFSAYSPGAFASDVADAVVELIA